jgi:dTDP-glucose 4,6-dehydratase
MKRVLITGAGGFVGSHVLRHVLINTDWEVVILDSFRHKGKTDRISYQMKGIKNAKKRVTVITHDLKAPISSQMDRAIGKIDYVLNLASESHVDRSITDPRDFIENNVALILTMLEWLKQRNTDYHYSGYGGVSKFIHISTDEVYGPAPEGHNHKEGEPHKPSNPYSASKAAQEAICFSFWRTYNLPIIITNTMNIIGELQDTEKYIPMVIKKVYNDETVSVHGSADGTQIGSRFYLHARNQADALLYILNNVDAEMYGENKYNYNPDTEMTTMSTVSEPTTFNIVGEKETDNLELAQLVAKFAGKKLKYEIVDFHSSRPGHDLRYALDGTKLASYGWKPPFTFEQSLESTVKWTLKHPEWLLND